MKYRIDQFRVKIILKILLQITANYVLQEKTNKQTFIDSCESLRPEPQCRCHKSLKQVLFRYIDRILGISLLNNGFKEQMLRQPKARIIVIQLFFFKKNPNFKYVSKVVNYINSLHKSQVFIW